MTVPVTALSPLNTNYDPPRPWRCVTHAAHDCDGVVIGAVGAYPVCAAGALAEQAQRDRDAASLAAFIASPEGRRLLAEEAAMERRIEGRS